MTTEVTEKFLDYINQRILFLDIDGVICTDRAYLAYGQDVDKLPMRAFDPISLKLVSNLCEKYDLSVVISSTWRLVYDVYPILLTHGFKGKLYKPAPKTPDTSKLTRRALRGDDIRAWIEENGTPSCFLILDDSDEGIKYSNLEDYHTKTDFYNGLTFESYQLAEDILTSQLETPLFFNAEKKEGLRT